MKQQKEGQNRRQSLRHHRSDGDSGHSQSEGQDKPQIQHHVQHGGKDQKRQRRSGISQRVEHGGKDIVHEQKGHAQKIDSQIGSRRIQDIARRIQPDQDLPVHREAEHPKEDSHAQKGDERRIDRSFHPVKPPCPKILGGDDRSADPASDGDHHEHIGQGIGGSDRRQRVLSHKPPHNDGVRHIIKLLEQVAQDHGQGE